MQKFPRQGYNLEKTSLGQVYTTAFGYQLCLFWYRVYMGIYLGQL